MHKKAIAGVVAAGMLGSVATANVARADRGGDHRDKDRVSCPAPDEDRLAVVGLTSGGSLVCFSESRPGKAKTIGTITGLVTDTKLVGIDYRPATPAPRPRRRCST